MPPHGAKDSPLQIRKALASSRCNYLLLTGS